MSLEEKAKVLEYLLEFVTESRRGKIYNISNNRTEHITVALEDIKEPKDASAIIRTCECFGVNSVNIIGNTTKYKVNHDVAMGSYKWLNLRQFKEEKTNNTKACLDYLKDQGYRIVSTSPKQSKKSIYELDLNQKSALFFGSEENGLSQEVLNNSDEIIKIPMYGESESFNLSASAAIAIHIILSKLRESKLSWKLSEEELLELRLNWVRKVIKRSPDLEKRFYSQV